MTSPSKWYLNVAGFFTGLFIFLTMCVCKFGSGFLSKYGEYFAYVCVIFVYSNFFNELKHREAFKALHFFKKMSESFENIIEKIPSSILIQRMVEGVLTLEFVNQTAKVDLHI